MFRKIDEEVKFNVFQSMKQPRDMSVVSVIDMAQEEVIQVFIEERLVNETLAAIIMNFEEDLRIDLAETANVLNGMGSYRYEPKKLDLDMKNRSSS
ncbi:hypothetical protein R3W88_001057 [Solanum pinnatisectum]|uniref:Uncharacterized protein n=1 Tax=Solanum pinnatisectum TaxID=50273 RepID=A0AAV9MKG6_9SOLN|nr:hypothetical protein R3W88_001057 [Solanum pinnatisectum]